MTRIVMYGKDVANILGCSERTGRAKLLELKDILGKKKHQRITIKEFCKHEGLDLNEVKAILKR